LPKGRFSGSIPTVSDPSWQVRYAPPSAPAQPSVGIGFVILFSFLVSLIGAGLLHLVVGGGRGDAPVAIERVQVPDLVGLTVGDARRAIAETSLLLHAVGERPEGTIDAARIVAQTPLPGSVVRASDAIEVRLAGRAAVEERAARPASASTDPSKAAASSVGATARTPRVTVPRLAGLRVSDASRALRDAGLLFGKVTEVETAEHDVGTVIAQSHAEGDSLPEGAEVDVSVAVPPTALEVPDLARVSVSEARARLERLGLRARVVEMFHPSVATGHVIRLRPTPGSEVEPGSVVDVFVAE